MMIFERPHDVIFECPLLLPPFVMPACSIILLNIIICLYHYRSACPEKEAVLHQDNGMVTPPLDRRLGLVLPREERHGILEYGC